MEETAEEYRRRRLALKSARARLKALDDERRAEALRHYEARSRLSLRNLVLAPLRVVWALRELK